MVICLEYRQLGHVVMIERIVNRIKPLRKRGVLKYGLIQIVVPKQYVNRPAFAVIYIMLEKEYQRKPLEKTI
jgi:hypothetical protein